MRKKDWRFWGALVVFMLVTSVIFNVGIFSNPGFNIHDFCMGLSTEIVGVLFVLLVFDRYTNAIAERKERHRTEKESKTEKK